ncbi:unnamed protein product [Acanthosepion pharaonis]|uniref:Phytocyanin domain-containing protein n=1 Tax=Acanthosepion pharaonis TaxID=158019 RepID=A0A812C1D2_ACAPH|nr:unnamed protein product [Sepia pharaonis]
MTLNVDCLQLLSRHAHHCFAAHFRFHIIIINKIVFQSADIVVGNRHSNVMQVPPLLWVAVGFCLIPLAAAHVRMVCPKPKSPASSLYRQPPGSTSDRQCDVKPSPPGREPYTMLNPGPYTIRFEETEYHKNSPFRISLHQYGNNSTYCILLDQIPHNNEASTIGTYCKVSTYNFLQDILNVFFLFYSVGDTCSLDDDLCTAYCSVANVRIKMIEALSICNEVNNTSNQHSMVFQVPVTQSNNSELIATYNWGTNITQSDLDLLKTGQLHLHLVTVDQKELYPVINLTKLHYESGIYRQHSALYSTDGWLAGPEFIGPNATYSAISWSFGTCTYPARYYISRLHSVGEDSHNSSLPHGVIGLTIMESRVIVSGTFLSLSSDVKESDIRGPDMRLMGQSVFQFTQDGEWQGTLIIKKNTPPVKKVKIFSASHQYEPDTEVLDLKKYEVNHSSFYTTTSHINHIIGTALSLPPLVSIVSVVRRSPFHRLMSKSQYLFLPPTISRSCRCLARSPLFVSFVSETALSFYRVTDRVSGGALLLPFVDRVECRCSFYRLSRCVSVVSLLLPFVSIVCQWCGRSPFYRLSRSCRWRALPSTVCSRVSSLSTVCLDRVSGTALSLLPFVSIVSVAALSLLPFVSISVLSSTVCLDRVSVRRSLFYRLSRRVQWRVSSTVCLVQALSLLPFVSIVSVVRRSLFYRLSIVSVSTALSLHRLSRSCQWHGRPLLPLVSIVVVRRPSSPLVLDRVSGTALSLLPFVSIVSVVRRSLFYRLSRSCQWYGALSSTVCLDRVSGTALSLPPFVSIDSVSLLTVGGTAHSARHEDGTFHIKGFVPTHPPEMLDYLTKGTLKIKIKTTLFKDSGITGNIPKLRRTVCSKPEYIKVGGEVGWEANNTAIKNFSIVAGDILYFSYSGDDKVALLQDKEHFQTCNFQGEQQIGHTLLTHSNKNSIQHTFNTPGTFFIASQIACNHTPPLKFILTVVEDAPANKKFSKSQCEDSAYLLWRKAELNKYKGVDGVGASLGGVVVGLLILSVILLWDCHINSESLGSNGFERF